MDHIPLPAGATVSVITVPLLSSLIPYDFAGFTTFAQREGFCKHGRLDEARPPEQLASLVQSWLYFGLLSELIGRSIGPEDIGLNNSSKEAATLSSAGLPDLLDEWQRDLRQSGVGACDERLHSVHQVIEQAVESSIICDMFTPPVDGEVYGRVMLSVKTLLVTIVQFYNALAPEHPFSPRDWRLFPLVPPGTRQSAAAKVLLDGMLEAKVCPQAAHRICSSYNYLTAYYLLHLPRSRAANHQGCSPTTCQAYLVNEDTYTMPHTTSSCTCNQLSVDLEQLGNIITEGKVPLIRIKASDGSAVQLSMKAGSVGDSYVALSHVWMDGLGNPHSNSLLRCQLQRLHRLTRTAFGSWSDWIWIDTLCIPVSPDPKSERLRRQAISSMASIYQDAAAVLVLDAEIEAMAKPQSDSEFIAYILCSAWNSRCWTYQEAVLGQKLLFETREGRRKPRLDDVDFMASMADMQRFDIGQSKMRWFLWRVFHSPWSHLLAAIRFVYPLMPISDLLVTSFRICCGPQAWQTLYGHSPLSEEHSSSVRSYNMVIGIAWLTFAMVMVIVCLPASVVMLAIYWSMLATGLAVHCCVALFERDSTLPASVVLQQQMRLQLATDLVAELKPTSVNSGLQHVAPEAAATLRSQRFAKAWNSLVQRTATKPRDLSTILAGLTNVPLRRLVDLDPKERIRAIATSHERLPLSLLFDRRLAEEEHRDPYNPWLSTSPSEYLLPAESDAATVQVQDSYLTISPHELGDSYLWLKTKRDRFEGSMGPVDSPPTYRGDLDLLDLQSHELKVGTTCLVVNVSGSDGPITCRAIELRITETVEDFIRCTFEGPAEAEISRSLGEHMAQSKSAVPMVTVQIPLSRKGLDPQGYQPVINTYEHIIIVGAYVPLVPITTIAITGIIASQTTLIVLYIGLAVALAMLIASAWVGRVIRHLHNARVNQARADFFETRRARWAIAWLEGLAVNFAYVEGGPKRWFHFRNWGKYW